jgi:TolB-like protein
MNPSVSEELDETPERLNLGSMLLFVLAAVAGTTLAVWAFHFLHASPATTAGKLLPRIAVLPFHSLSAAPDDIQFDHKLTNALISGLTRVSRVEVPAVETDADPILVGLELGVKMIIIGKVEKLAGQVRVRVQIVSTRDGSQVWVGSFDGDSSDPSRLSAQIETAVAPHLTALLD